MLDLYDRLYGPHPRPRSFGDFDQEGYYERDDARVMAETSRGTKRIHNTELRASRGEDGEFREAMRVKGD